MKINKRSGWWLVLIAVIYLVAIYVIGCYDAHALTAQVTWDVPTDDAVEYRFYYRVDSDEWRFHRSVIAITLPVADNRTGRRFTAPDNGKMYRLVITAVDAVGNMSGATAQIVIDTFGQSVSVDPEPVAAEALPNTS